MKRDGLHPMYRGVDITYTLMAITSGTGFFNFNRTNKLNRWVSGRAASFFVSGRRITAFPKKDHRRLLDNVHTIVQQEHPTVKMSNYKTGEIVECC